jgi:hypothetical protein
MPGGAAMLEESLDPRPMHDTFARFMAVSAAESADRGTVEGWLASWSDNETAWCNLRNIEHWIARGRR